MSWEETVEIREYELNDDFELTETSGSLGEKYSFTPSNTWTEEQ